MEVAKEGNGTAEELERNHDEVEEEEELTIIGMNASKRKELKAKEADRKQKRKKGKSKALTPAQESGLAGTRDEEDNRLRKELQIKVSGGVAPPPLRSFEELKHKNCSSWLLQKVIPQLSS